MTTRLPIMTTHLPSFKTKLKTHFFFLTPPGLHLSFNLFVVRANAIFYKLARASVCIELNWIELNWQLVFQLQLLEMRWNKDFLAQQLLLLKHESFTIKLRNIKYLIRSPPLLSIYSS